jgi:Mg2+-importing ATPase
MLAAGQGAGVRRLRREAAIDPNHAYWSRPADELMAALGTNARGLSTAVALERLRRDGPNVVEDRPQITALRLLLRQYESPLVLILVFGALISLLLRDWADASIILAIVFGSTLLGFSQEYRASNAMAELRRRLALTAQVFRDGALKALPAAEIVPGDVVRLSAGNLVPADGVVIEAKDFLVVEASLTGESYPVEKQPGVAAADAALSARANCVLLGTSVRSGTATVLVVKTGRGTEFGRIAATLRMRAPETDFARGIRQFGYLLVRVMIVLVLFALTVNLLLERPVIDSLLFSVALAVGLSPELLPAIVSVTLSAGARAMADRGVIVRRLDAIENLGSMDILCVDKTGTLTEGSMALTAAVDAEGRPSAEVQRLAFLNAAFETGIENPLDAAIIAACRREHFSTGGFRKIDEIPYDFLRKRLTIVLVEEGDAASHLIVTKGAFDNVLAVCSRIEGDGGAALLDEACRVRLARYFRTKGSEGFRVLGVASKRVPAKTSYRRDDETDMAFAGFLLFFDPLKSGVEATIRDLAALGVRLKIISGDNRYVTAHVAAAIGLNPRAMLTGEEIADLRDESFWHRAARTDLFVEVDPQQKARIVRALRRTGHAVGYLGDGINDAPALHASDVGISVDQAVDVARESADIVLLRPDLDVLRQGVEDGRRTFANTLKYIRITLSANFGNMVSMALAAPLLPFLPLLAKQILLNNFLSDLPSIAISTDNVDRDKVAKAQHWRIGELQRFMIVFGLISSAFDLLSFLVLLYGFGVDEPTFQTAWFVLSLLTELAVVLVLRTQRPALRSVPSGLLLGSTIVVGALALMIPYLGVVATAFGFVSLSGAILGSMVAIVAAYVVVTEIAKLKYFGARTLPRKHAARVRSRRR